LGRYSSALQVLDGMGGSEKALSTQQSAVSQGQS
jgi:hypothetical protein